MPSTGPRCRRVRSVRGSAGSIRRFLGPARRAVARDRRDAAVTLVRDVARRAARRREDGRRARRRPARRRLRCRRRSPSPRSTPTAGATSRQRFPKVRVVPSPAWAVADADVVIVAVKPGDVAATLEAALAALGERHARALDRGRRHDRDARSARAGPAGRAGDAEHARARRARRVGDRAGCDTRPTSTSSSPTRCSAAVGIVVRVAEHAARRGHRALGLGPGLRVPRRRGADRSGRARRPAPADRRRSSSSRRCSASATLLAQGDDGPGGAAGRGHVARRHDRGRACASSKRAASAPRSSTRSSPPRERSQELGQKDAAPVDRARFER